MATISPRLVELLKSYGEDNTAVWDCHGTWVAYHAAVERMAAKAGIIFQKPDMVVNDYNAKTVVVCVSATMGDKSEWSFGEVAPSNNKNAYPYAMAEKRAKDRVALKLLGMAGLVYSEEEADDFKPEDPKDRPVTASKLKKDGVFELVEADLETDMAECRTFGRFEELRKTYRDLGLANHFTPAFMRALDERLDHHETQVRSRVAYDNMAQDMKGAATLSDLVEFWKLHAKEYMVEMTDADRKAITAFKNQLKASLDEDADVAAIKEEFPGARVTNVLQHPMAAG
jgi:hypothetical protein